MSILELGVIEPPFPQQYESESYEVGLKRRHCDLLLAGCDEARRQSDPRPVVKDDHTF
jgi:hypothetical protein